MLGLSLRTKTSSTSHRRSTTANLRSCSSYAACSPRSPTPSSRSERSAPAKSQPRKSASGAGTQIDSRLFVDVSAVVTGAAEHLTNTPATRTPRTTPTSNTRHDDAWLGWHPCCNESPDQTPHGNQPFPDSRPFDNTMPNEYRPLQVTTKPQ